MNFFKKKNKKQMYIMIFSIIIIIFLILLCVFSFVRKNDGMKNANDIKVYYKVYENNKWTSWNKNGLTAGNKKDYIKNIQIKVKSKKDGYVAYYIYDKNKKWTKQIASNKNKNKKINKTYQMTGIKMFITDSLYDRFDLCYRTYNKENKWMEWNCDGGINGNIDNEISAIQIKVIPKNVLRNEWLKDYKKNVNKKNKIGF